MQIENIDPIAIKRELLKRELESSFHKFVQYAFLKIHRKKFITKPFHLRLINHMESIHRGDMPQSIINIPPRYGKTLICVVLFSAWSFAKNRKCKFIHLSFSESLVLANSNEIREIISSDWFQELWSIEIKKEVNAKNEWATKEGGIFYAAPTAGQVTGRGAGASDDSDEKEELYDWLKRYDDIVSKQDISSDKFSGCILIDDPSKPDDGSSEVKMSSVNDRLNNTILSRRNSPTKTPITIIMQRISEIDMTAFCLDGKTGEKWTNLCIPAIEIDQNGNERAIWEEKHTLDKLKTMRQADPKTFSGQYMQAPTPLEGTLFKRENWKIVDVATQGISVRGYDLAATKGKSSAYTASVKITKHHGKYYIEDVQNDRLDPNGVENNMLLNAQLDGKKVKISFPKDPGQAGVFQAEYLVSKLSGYIVTATPETGSKEQRAMALSSQQSVGNVLLVAGKWNAEFIEQATSFPNGKYKDMVDAASRAFHEVLEFGGQKFDDVENNVQTNDVGKAVIDAFF